MFSCSTEPWNISTEASAYKIDLEEGGKGGRGRHIFERENRRWGKGDSPGAGRLILVLTAWARYGDTLLTFSRIRFSSLGVFVRIGA